MSVKLRKRKNGDGTTSLILDIYHNGQRKYEFLKELKLVPAKNAVDRQINKERLDMAEKIAVKRGLELADTDNMFSIQAGKKTSVTDWMQTYIDKYDKKDIRSLQGALNRFKDFLKDEKRTGLTFGQLDALLIEDFIHYLEKNSEGEGAASYYARFKKMIKQAYRKKLMKDNVIEFVQTRPKGKAEKKDILTLEELKLLSETPIENQEIRRAFLFCAVTGLRWIDVNNLKWGDIDLTGGSMKVKQSKTGEAIVIPLNTTAIKLLGDPSDRKEPVFILPTANGANKTLKSWVKRAGINKKITWHNSRHSFGTNLIFNQVDVLTASKLLGHTSMKHTMRYVDAAEEMKRTATDKINFDL